jgi:aminopeptidase N
MEYAMSTLITGERSFESLVGVMVHEMAHSWFQQVLATNESKHEWMDEGFTSFISSLCMNAIMDQQRDNPFEGSYRGYYALVQSGREQPLSTHADRYSFNRGYGISAYSKGAVFLAQLGYVIGQDKLMETIRRYYSDFKFRHPTPNDVIRTAEKVSGLQLGWYLTDWTQTTNTIDYALTAVEGDGGRTRVTLERKGLMPMPIDLLVVLKDESSKVYHLPLRMMRGTKDNPYPGMAWEVRTDWPWAQPVYSLELDVPKEQVQAVLIDPSGLMADVDSENNLWQPE